jgi:hypothetical protein
MFQWSYRQQGALYVVPALKTNSVNTRLVIKKKLLIDENWQSTPAKMLISLYLNPFDLKFGCMIPLHIDGREERRGADVPKDTARVSGGEGVS